MNHMRNTKLCLLGMVAVGMAFGADAKPGDGAYIKIKPTSKKALVVKTSLVGDRFALLDDLQVIGLDIDAYPGESRTFNNTFSVRLGSEESSGRVSEPKSFPGGPDDVTVEISNSEMFKGAWVESECMARLQNAANQSNKSKAAVIESGWWTSFKTSLPIEVSATADDPWTPFIQQLPRRGSGGINGVTIMCGASGAKGVGEAGMGPVVMPLPEGPEGQGGGGGSSEPNPPREATPSRATKPPRDTSSAASTGAIETMVLTAPVQATVAGLNPYIGRWGSGANGDFLRLRVRNDGSSTSAADQVVFTLVDQMDQTTSIERNLPSLAAGEVHTFEVPISLPKETTKHASAKVKSNGATFDFPLE